MRPRRYTEKHIQAVNRALRDTPNKKVVDILKEVGFKDAKSFYNTLAYYGYAKIPHQYGKVALSTAELRIIEQGADDPFSPRYKKISFI